MKKPSERNLIKLVIGALVVIVFVGIAILLESYWWIIPVIVIITPLFVIGLPVLLVTFFNWLYVSS